MTRIDKSKDGIIGPEPALPIYARPVDPKPLKRMNKAELIDVALSRNIDTEGKTKAQLIVELEENG
jgi:hypothetical protein